MLLTITIVVAFPVAVVEWWFLAPIVFKSRERRAAEAAISGAEVPAFLHYRNRISLGSTQEDVRDIYVAPKGSLRAPLVKGPPGYTYYPPNGTLCCGYRFFGVWKGEELGLPCEVGAVQLFEPAEQEVYAELRPREAAQAQRGDFAVVEVSATCG